jgi:hemerythrin
MKESCAMLQPDQIASELSPDERLMIDEEHARLEQFLEDLRDTCENFGVRGNCYGCNRTQVATCQGRLSSFFYDFLDLVDAHFDTEEKIMLGSLKASSEDTYFLQHQAEHVRLINEVRNLMRESAVFSQQGNPSEAIRRLESKLDELFGVHAHEFDAPFLQATQVR